MHEQHGLVAMLFSVRRSLFIVQYRLPSSSAELRNRVGTPTEKLLYFIAGSYEWVVRMHGIN